ncbi:M15 family metallopeptidase, partial [Brevundimonas aurantiaca]|uniref:M15 family metallopeptidase n=1 Tax=Brevundimonas aurantiaca TaxID=74316 RepID=UPI001CD67625
LPASCSRSTPMICASLNLLFFTSVSLMKRTLTQNEGSGRGRLTGYGHAVDLCPYPVDWNSIPKFKAIESAMKQAALAEGVRIVAGADWSKPDRPHFELA